MLVKEKITIADLAERLNVSKATISKALSGKGSISEEMRGKVRDLARELKFSPNFAAQALKRNSSDAILVLISGDITNPWYSQLVSQLEEELDRFGKTMYLALGKNDPAKNLRCINNFSGGRVAGVILGPVLRQKDWMPSGLWELFERKLPIVLFNCLDELPVSYIAIDVREGARLAVEHLIMEGHRKIAYLCCPPTEIQEPGRTRQEGFTQALFKHKLPLTEDCLITGEFTRSHAYELMRNLLKKPRHTLPTAFFCHNDDVALGAMLAIHEAGLSIPGDIALVGFDDIPEGGICRPALTTVGGVMRTLAHELVKTLMFTIEGEGKTELVKKLIVPQLIIRDSSSKSPKKSKRRK